MLTKSRTSPLWKALAIFGIFILCALPVAVGLSLGADNVLAGQDGNQGGGQGNQGGGQGNQGGGQGNNGPDGDAPGNSDGNNQHNDGGAEGQTNQGQGQGGVDNGNHHGQNKGGDDNGGGDNGDGDNGGDNGNGDDGGGEGDITLGLGTATAGIEFYELVINMQDKVIRYPVTADGTLLVDVSISFPNGKLTLQIAAGTTVLNPDGSPAYLNRDPDVIGVTAIAPAPPRNAVVLESYQLTPSGLIFRGGTATLLANYDPAKVPAGAGVSWAYYNERTGLWDNLETAGFVAAAVAPPNSLVTRVQHFTYFAILAQ